MAPGMTQAGRLLAVGVFAGLVLAQFRPDSRGFTALGGFGEKWEDRRTEALQALPRVVREDSFGYDGQFYAQLALDPGLRGEDLESALDAPAYRARRIGMPALAWLLGAGQPWWVLQIYCLLNVAAWGALAWLWWGELEEEKNPGRKLARWAGLLFSVGVLDSVRFGQTDLPMLLLLVLAVRAAREGKGPGGWGFWSTALLVRETALLAAPGLWPRRDGTAGSWARAGGATLLAVAPLAVWLGFVHRVFPAYDGLTGNLGWPLAGWFDRAAVAVGELSRGNLDTRYVFGLVAGAGLGLQAWVVARAWQPDHPWWRVGMAFAGLFLLLGVEPWRGYWAAARILLPLTAAFFLLLRPGRGFWWYYGLAAAPAAHGILRMLS